jgi:hypothetical protein
VADRLIQAIVLVTELDASRRRLESAGLTVLDGGRHPGRGTANLIVPFGSHHLELLSVVDEAEAQVSPKGRPVLAALARRGPGLARWSVETDSIEATARRLGRAVEPRQRVRPDGVTVRWRAVGVDAAWEDPWRCAFMTWDDPELHPARVEGVVHANGATGFARLEVTVPYPDALLEWLGDAVPDELTVSVGADTGPRALFLASPEGEIPMV